VAVPKENEAQVEADFQLIERILDGDENAFDNLVGHYQNMVYNLSYRFMGNAQEAEDLTQEVFLKIFRSVRSFRGASTLKTWIYRITTNMALNRIKFNKRRRRERQISIDRPLEPDMPPMNESLPDERPGPERVAHSGEIQERLQEALDSINEDQKAVVILRDVEGLSYEDIAVALDINIGTVKSRLARGRAGIQELLRDLL
jgi:RNA polymerase sigma-70 factor (ECF subfamily)